MDRRDFLRSSCFGCAALAFGAVALESCTGGMAVVKVPATGPMQVPLDRFATAKQVLVRSPELPQDILVTKRADGSFAAVYLMCSHRAQPLTPTATELHCPTHGSRFSLEGAVLEGPATEPLQLFRTTTDGDHLVIAAHSPHR